MSDRILDEIQHEITAKQMVNILDRLFTENANDESISKEETFEFKNE